MKRLTVDSSKTNSFPPIFLDYISRKESLSAFYKYPFDISSFKKVIEDKSKEAINRKVLVEVLKEQNPGQSALMDTLLSDKTFTVTTGHQLCIFTGPLYSVYKLLSTIKLAQELKKHYAGYNFVPVFWMVTEDHDFEEVNKINVFGKRLEWKPADQEDKTGKVAVGQLHCSGLNSLIDQLKDLIAGENAEYLLNLFRSAYSEKNNLTQATRIIINELFGKYGLVILDASDKRLKNIFKDVMKEDVLKQSSFKNVSETIIQLESFHYRSQVHPREINLFYLDNGRRSRIVRDDKGFAVLDSDKKFSEAELTGEIDKFPERFSPNVVLRPLYQEKILPNLAYVGGPGEVSYWLEYKKMFGHYKVNYPLLAIRSYAMWLDGVTSSKLEKLSLKPEEIFLETESLVKAFLEHNFDHSFSLDEESKQIEELFAALAQKANMVDATLKSSVEAEKHRQLSALKHIEDKIIRAQKKKHETSINQVRKIKEKLFPDAMLQERYENFIPYYLKYGAAYFDMLLESFEALPGQFLILEEDK